MAVIEVLDSTAARAGARQQSASPIDVRLSLRRCSDLSVQTPATKTHATPQDHLPFANSPVSRFLCAGDLRTGRRARIPAISPAPQ